MGDSHYPDYITFNNLPISTSATSTITSNPDPSSRRIAPRIRLSSVRPQT